jgi:hypothetical protein
MRGQAYNIKYETKALAGETIKRKGRLEVEEV